MNVTFKESKSIAHNIRSFYFVPEKPVRYTAGQFIELYLPHDEADNRGIKRWFTLSSAPSDDRLSITTNFTPSHSSSFKQALLKLKKGTQLQMQSPMGDFVLPKKADIPLVFVAGGIGCTPFHSILSQLKKDKEKRDITLIYSAYRPRDIAFKDTFKNLGKKFKTIYQEPPNNYKGATGFLSADKILELGSVTKDHYIYLSGSELMVEQLIADLKNHDINKKHLFGDYYPNYLPGF